MATTVDDRRETVSLIGSDKVDGTAVYGADDNKIGSVQRVMIDKISGKVAYAPKVHPLYELELVRPGQRSARVRLLQHPSLVLIDRRPWCPAESPAPCAGDFCYFDLLRSVGTKELSRKRPVVLKTGE